MKNTFLAAGVAFASLVGANASATTITLSVFDITDFDTETAGGVIQDFETASNVLLGSGDMGWDSSTVTNVGKFSSEGGTGSGSVCTAQSGGPCDSLFINDTVLSGQGNLVPTGGLKALSSNDTNGIFWDVFLAGGALFNKVVFGVRDAADISGTTFTIETDDGTTATLTGQANNNEKLVVIDLGGSFSGATVSMFNNQVNDGFTIDGAAVSPIPVPAALPLLLAGIAGFGFVRRQQKRKAA